MMDTSIIANKTYLCTTGENLKYERKEKSLDIFCVAIFIVNLLKGKEKTCLKVSATPPKFKSRMINT